MAGRMNDFPSGIAEDVRHRPWPLPDAPWIMTQTWHDLLFAHWPVAVAALRDVIPPALELDLFDRQGWLGVVPFHMTNVAPRGVPALPWVSAFPELNVRTYVRAYGKPGVYFFSLDATSPLAVAVARAVFRLPYFQASIDVDVDAAGIRYHCRRTARGAAPAEFRARYRPAGPAHAAAPGSLEYFLTERYCLYTVDGRARVRRLEIHHLPWALQQAEADIEANTMAGAAGIRLASTAPLLHFARRQDTIAWAPAICDSRFAIRD